jgi:hypothetical protein
MTADEYLDVLGLHAMTTKQLREPFNSMPMIVSSDAISEGTNVDLFTEACLLGLCFEGLDLIADALVGSAACPFGLGWKRLANVWQAAEF